MSAIIYSLISFNVVNMRLKSYYFWHCYFDERGILKLTKWMDCKKSHQRSPDLHFQLTAVLVETSCKFGFLLNEKVPEILQKKRCCTLDIFRHFPPFPTLCLQVHFWNLLAVSHTRRELYLFCTIFAGSFEVAFLWTLNLQIQNFV